MRKEPALLYGILSAILALAVAYGFIGSDTVDLWEALFVAVIPIVQALFTRSKVVPVATVNEAGLTTKDLRARALDSSIEPAVEGGFHERLDSYDFED
jgi:hypothetical protein